MIFLCLLISLACVGTHVVLKELVGHFTTQDLDGWYASTFNEEGEFTKPTLLTHASKPLFYCVTCMASVWGTFYYILLAPIHLREWELVLCYVPTLMIVALLNTYIYKQFNK